MRPKKIPIGQYTKEQSDLAATLNASIEKHLQGFVTKRADGELIGPFNILLHYPALGSAVWSVFTALADQSTLPAAVREVEILMTGARYSALYELYSHEAVALEIGMPPDKVATLAAGQRPLDLTREERIAFDVVSILHRGGQIPNTRIRPQQSALGSKALRNWRAQPVATASSDSC